MSNIVNKNIKGWGVDALKDNPNYPMKKQTEGDNEGMNWMRPEQQPIDVEVLHSNERPSVSAVFGNTLPPKALSGILRRFAFNYSESSWYHWLTLMAADRIDMIEGIVEDLKKGHIPNILAERGIKSELKYNKKNLAIKVGIATILAYGAIKYLRKK